MKRILLLCFIHGFKGTDDTFRDFPYHLKTTIAKQLPDDRVESVVYPKYETKGELAQSTAAFLEWLRERVMEQRKAHVEKPWPPNDGHVGVILVAHSMGGFVASDTLFRILDERHRDGLTGPLFPFIQGILAFDTPYNGLARSMFVYGAFSNYHKVSNVFNVMTALSAAAPAGLARLTARKSAASAMAKSVSASRPAWKLWQVVAVRTGTVGVIAAGGVAAYMHRKEIVQGMRALNKDSVKQGYQQGVDVLGQGLAYVNRGSVGESFAWLSDHFTFVGALMKQGELSRRLDRMASLKGVGIRDVYASLGENGYWSGGYFVPERTFCAVPTREEPAAKLFARHVVRDASDEIEAHINMFNLDKNKAYESMTDEAASLVIGWFQDEAEIADDAKFAGSVPSEPSEEEALAQAVQGSKDMPTDVADVESDEEKIKETGLPDLSPVDIAAAASVVPLPEDVDQLTEEGGNKEGQQTTEERQAYMRHLFGIAQQTGTNLRSFLPSKLPTREDMPTISMPRVNMPSIPSMNMPAFLSRKATPELLAKSEEGTTEPGAVGTGDGSEQGTGQGNQDREH